MSSRGENYGNLGQNDESNNNASQSLKEVFARLTVATNNASPLDSAGERLCSVNASGGYDGIDRYDFDFSRCYLHRYCPSMFYNDASNVSSVRMPSQNCNGGGAAASVSRSEISRAAVSVRRREILRGFPAVPRLNCELGYGFRRRRIGLWRRSFHDLRGRIVELAKDKCGSRLLQEMMNNGICQEEISFVFQEVIGSFIELLLNENGSQVFQKLVIHCTQEQRTLIISVLTRHESLLVQICRNNFGSIAVQTLFDYVTTQEQRDRIIASLCYGVVALIRDTNGQHVIVRCLRNFSYEDNKYVLAIIAHNCYDIATDKIGCCAINSCVDYARVESKEQLMALIIKNAPHLSENCYGNYVVQHLLDLKIPIVTHRLMTELQGHFFSLSCNKFGSHVVEKFLNCSGEMNSLDIIWELISNPNVADLLVDQFGNYVIQSALLTSKGGLRDILLKIIHQNSPRMRSNLYGKKLLSHLRRWNYDN